MEVAQQDRCFRASDDKYDEHKEQKSEHVVHLTWPAHSEISSHNKVLYNLYFFFYFDAFHPVVYNNIALKYKPNSRPTQLFIKQIHNICGGDMFWLLPASHPQALHNFLNQYSWWDPMNLAYIKTLHFG
jgi:hypothetical protein